VLINKQVKANYGQMLFDGAEAGFDYLDVSRRALQRIDFKLQDSFGNVLDLRGNHWSFSLVFQTHTYKVIGCYVKSCKSVHSSVQISAKRFVQYISSV
jgi:hypothetical protein